MHSWPTEVRGQRSAHAPITEAALAPPNPSAKKKKIKEKKQILPQEELEMLRKQCCSQFRGSPLLVGGGLADKR